MRWKTNPSPARPDTLKGDITQGSSSAPISRDRPFYPAPLRNRVETNSPSWRREEDLSCQAQQQQQHTRRAAQSRAEPQPRPALILLLAAMPNLCFFSCTHAASTFATFSTTARTVELFTPTQLSKHSVPSSPEFGASNFSEAESHRVLNQPVTNLDFSNWIESGDYLLLAFRLNPFDPI